VIDRVDPELVRLADSAGYHRNAPVRGRFFVARHQAGQWALGFMVKRLCLSPAMAE
jgi:hypothetical protein